VSVAPGLQAPAGVYFAGLALILRDAVQVLLGRKTSVLAIPVGAALSWFIAPALAVASGTAFLLSESADWLVFTPLQNVGGIELSSRAPSSARASTQPSSCGSRSTASRSGKARSSAS
jgi:hypothetical protein